MREYFVASDGAHDRESMANFIPPQLAAFCASSLEASEWLSRLPQTINDLASRWSLTLDPPFEGEDVSCSWVAPATLADGTLAILKIGLPHMEAEHEIDALRLLNGEPTARLLESDRELNAMLIERCEPGHPLRDMFQPDQDVVIAGLLKRYWRIPAEPHPFRPLSVMIDYWMKQTRRDEPRWHDASLVADGLDLFEELSLGSLAEVLLATDLHAGNVLSSRREPWLMIDPKPFVGERAFDATQHLLNCRSRLRIEPFDTMHRMADLLEVDYDRVRAWTFARLAAEPRDNWDDEATELAKKIA
jgi:streptomycin 6-kinase